MVTPAIVKFYPFWNDEYKHLNYYNREFSNSEDVQLWKSLGIEKITGDMCPFGEKHPEWTSIITRTFKDNYGWNNIGCTFYRMMPGTMLPTHIDKYKNYAKVVDLVGEEYRIKRALIFLEDWQSGHYFELNGSPHLNWRAGDVQMWDHNVPHAAGNMGVTPRYTLQITGHL